MGVVKFHLAAKFEGVDAYSYMGFAMIGDLLQFPWRKRGVRMPIVFYGFRQDSDIIIVLTTIHGRG